MKVVSFSEQTMGWGEDKKKKDMRPREYEEFVVTILFSRVWLFETPWIVASQAPLSMDFWVFFWE